MLTITQPMRFLYKGHFHATLLALMDFHCILTIKTVYIYVPICYESSIFSHCIYFLLISTVPCKIEKNYIKLNYNCHGSLFCFFFNLKREL